MTKLTNRDMQILWSCGVSQVLTTSQIQRWHFGSTCLRNVQKRLQKLVEAGFLNVIETRVCTDNLVLLGKVGHAELQKTGWKAELRQEAPKDLQHHLGVVDIRIALDRSLPALPGMQLRYCYAYWELGRSARTAHDPSEPLGWAEIRHPFHPLRGQSFPVLKTRCVAGVDTLILRGLECGTFSVAREWTDCADPSPSLGLSPRRWDADLLLDLANLLEQLSSQSSRELPKGD